MCVCACVCVSERGLDRISVLASLGCLTLCCPSSVARALSPSLSIPPLSLSLSLSPSLSLRARRGYIRLEELYLFMREVPAPLGLGKFDSYVSKFLPVRCELAVKAQERKSVREHLLAQPLVKSMMHLENAIIASEMRRLGGLDRLDPGQRVFLALEDWPKQRDNSLTTRTATSHTLCMRPGDFVIADSRAWIDAFQSNHPIWVPVSSHGRRGSVPPHILRWLRMPGEKSDTPPWHDVDPEFAGMQYSALQLESVLTIQCWGRQMLAYHRVRKMRASKHARDRMSQVCAS